MAAMSNQSCRRAHTSPVNSARAKPCCAELVDSSCCPFAGKGDGEKRVIKYRLADGKLETSSSPSLNYKYELGPTENTYPGTKRLSRWPDAFFRWRCLRRRTDFAARRGAATNKFWLQFRPSVPLDRPPFRSSFCSRKRGRTDSTVVSRCLRDVNREKTNRFQILPRSIVHFDSITFRHVVDDLTPFFQVIVAWAGTFILLLVFVVDDGSRQNAARHLLGGATNSSISYFSKLALGLALFVWWVLLG